MQLLHQTQLFCFHYVGLVQETQQIEDRHHERDLQIHLPYQLLLHLSILPGARDVDGTRGKCWSLRFDKVTFDSTHLSGRSKRFVEEGVSRGGS